MSVTVVSMLVRVAPARPAGGCACGEAHRGATRTAVWRLGVAGSGLTGVLLAAAEYDVWWTALSQLASLGVALGYGALGLFALVGGDCRVLPASWLRGGLATLMVLVSVAYLAWTGGDVSRPYSLVEHLVTPLLVVADVALVGRARLRVRWWHPVTWTLPPAAYLGFYVLADLRVYEGLDPGRPAVFGARVLVLLLLVLAAGLGVTALSRWSPYGSRPDLH